MRAFLSVHKWVVALLLLYLLLPIAATLLYSVADQWDTTIFPRSLTFQWYAELFQDQRFFQALLRTLFLIVTTVGISVIVMIPTIYVVTVYCPQWERVLQGLSLLPYGIPPVVAAVGLLRIYSAGPFPLAGTPWILVGAYFILIMPFMYQGIRNSLRTIRAQELAGAAELLGASKITAFVKVVLPNIFPGVVVSTSLSVAMLFGEFALANLLVGGRFETVQIYLYQKFSKSGHLSSAVVITYYLVILLLSWIVFKASGRNMAKLNPLIRDRRFHAHPSMKTRWSFGRNGNELHVVGRSQQEIQSASRD